TWMPWAGAAVGAGGGVGGGGGGATGNGQGAACRAAATALPASAAVLKETVGQSNVAPVVQAGIWLTIFRLSSPAVRAARSCGARPIPTGRRANGVRLPKSWFRVGRTRLAVTPFT